MTDLTLADQVLATCATGKISGTKLNERARNVLNVYRQKLLAAERFDLDDAAVAEICRLSHERERLASWSMLARIPYDPVWFEFSLHAKLRAFEAMDTLQHPFDPEKTSTHLGYLMYRDAPDGARWVCHQFAILRNEVKNPKLNGEIIPNPITFIFDPEGGLNVFRGSTSWNAPTLSRIIGFAKSKLAVNIPDLAMIHTECDPEFTLCGIYDLKDRSLALPLIDKNDIITSHADDIVKGPDWFISKAGAIIDPFWNQHWVRNAESLYELVSHEVQEQAGSLRWVVTMLAAINALPREVRPLKSRPGRRIAAPGVTVPYLGSSHLTFTIPRENRIAWTRQQLDREAIGARRRWHRVIGHWRVVDPGRSRGRMCRHVPAMVDQGLAICENCEMLIRWIELPNGRGDPSIGIVEQSHHIVA